jgi:hypothetical protein
MPKIHNLGHKHFAQVINFPVKWEKKLWVRGWTQELTEPFRTSSPVIVRMPSHKAFVIGKWTGNIDSEEEALQRAIEGRVLTDEDFQEGWQPPAYKAGEAGSEDWDY